MFLTFLPSFFLREGDERGGENVKTLEEDKKESSFLPLLLSFALLPSTIHVFVALG